MPSADRASANALDERAFESLEFIRTTMARSASFTAVSGWGGVAMGVVGLAASVVASRVSRPTEWLAVWLSAAAVAVAAGTVAMHIKAAQHRIPLWSAAGRRFAQGFAPSLAAGAVLTLTFARLDSVDLLPSLWLLLYGAGVLAGATASVPVLTWMGAALMALGVGAALVGRWGDLWLAAGFGGLHVVFGIIIARKHGG